MKSHTLGSLCPIVRDLHTPALSNGADSRKAGPVLQSICLRPYYGTNNTAVGRRDETMRMMPSAMKPMPQMISSIA